MYQTYEEAVAANPEHPVVLHGQYCLQLIAYENHAVKVRETVLAFFNR